MKKTRLILGIALVSGYLGIGLGLGSHARAKSLAEIRKAGVFRTATEGTFAPFNFFKGKELVGFEVELVNEISKKLKIKNEWKYSSFDSLLIGLNHDRYDIVASSHGITPERANVVDFSDPHYCTSVVIVSKKGGPKKVSELKGKVVAVEVGTISVPYLEKVPGIKKVQTFPKDPDCTQALGNGKVDAWVTDRLVAAEAQKGQPAYGLELGETFLEQRVAMAVSKGNSELLKAVNAALAELKADGTVKKLGIKYVGEDISCH